ncbi:nitroreductase family protein [Aquipuribacter sp. MA13-6]|uniref:nitroreductase family protein n=1 Tax=unclassified Aquipuribacter TaxID=2635084 RepID=UPI003EEBBD7D
MEHQDVVRARRMVRSYDPSRPVADEVLARLLEQATRAPSAGHTQGRDLVVLRGTARERFWDVTTAGTTTGPDRWQRGMRTAPVLVLCLSDPGRYVQRYAESDKAGDRAADGAAARGSGPDAWPIPFWDVDTGMAALLLLLGAVDAGLGACFFGVPDHRHDDVRHAFGLPRDRRLVGVVSLGHPAPDRRSPSLRRGRRPLAETVHEGRYGVPFSPGPQAPSQVPAPTSGAPRDREHPGAP